MASSAIDSCFTDKLQQYSSKEVNRRGCSICKSRYRPGYAPLPPTQQGVGVVTLCIDFAFSCGHLDHIQQAPRMPVEDFHEHLCGVHVNVAECAQVLNTLAGVLPQLRSLVHIGLHSLPLQPQLMPAVGQALLDLPASVTALTLTTSAAAQQGPVQRGMLFSSIALVRGLRELHMPDWEAVVGEDGVCVEPLHGLPHLATVHVPHVKQSGAYPAGLTFKAPPDETATADGAVPVVP